MPRVQFGVVVPAFLLQVNHWQKGGADNKSSEAKTKQTSQTDQGR